MNISTEKRLMPAQRWHNVYVMITTFTITVDRAKLPTILLSIYSWVCWLEGEEDSTICSLALMKQLTIQVYLNLAHTSRNLSYGDLVITKDPTVSQSRTKYSGCFRFIRGFS